MQDNLVLWSAIVGFFLPMGISVINKEAWSAQVKSIIAFLICLIAAAVEVYLKGEVDLSDYVTAALVILVSSIAFYHGFYKPSGISPAIESNILG